MLESLIEVTDTREFWASRSCRCFCAWRIICAIWSRASEASVPTWRRKCCAWSGICERRLQGVTPTKASKWQSTSTTRTNRWYRTNNSWETHSVLRSRLRSCRTLTIYVTRTVGGLLAPIRPLFPPIPRIAPGKREERSNHRRTLRQLDAQTSRAIELYRLIFATVARSREQRWCVSRAVLRISRTLSRNV